jgi:HAD superfamily hydrolase (TIGR01549 family)
MPKKILIFDFDFTLADSLDSILKFSNQIAPLIGLRTFTKADFEEVKKLSLKQVIKKYNVKPFQVWILKTYVKLRLLLEKNSFKAIAGTKTLLKDLKKEGYKIGIMSYNSKANIAKFLLNEKIDFIDFIETEKSMFGKHKMMNRFLKAKKLSPSNVIYIGDEIRDIKAMRKVEVPIISTAWGISEKEKLEAYNPDLVVEKPKEVIQKIKELEYIL